MYPLLTFKTTCNENNQFQKTKTKNIESYYRQAYCNICKNKFNSAMKSILESLNHDHYTGEQRVKLICNLRSMDQTMITIYI